MIVFLEVLAGLSIAALGIFAILEPIIRSPARVAEQEHEDDLEEWELDEDLTSPKARALSALKEIEFDRATGKLDDDDYARLKNKYTKLAIDAMREKEAAVAVTSTPSEMSIDDLAEAQIRAAGAALESGPGGTCPDCGERPEVDAKFCSNCGKALALAVA